MKTRSSWLTLALGVFVGAIFVGITCAQSGPRNLGFEEGNTEGVPEGWMVPTPGYSAKLSRQQPKSGTYCVELAPASESGRAPFGNLMQSFDAGPYRGKRVRFRAAVRTESPTQADRAQLWFRVDRQNGEMGFFDNMGDRPIRENDWRFYEITGDVESDANRINIGVMLLGSGKVWIDDASFEVLGDSPKLPIEPARALTGRGLQNEIAFARLYGLVRYFHPSDQSAHTDWDSFAIMGARAIEGARDDTELKQTLTSLFESIAPTIRIVLATQRDTPGLTDLAPKDAPDSKVTYWRHTGIGISTRTANIYHSDRVQVNAATASSSKAPTPNSLWKADLGGGVEAWVPLALYVDAQGTLPHAQDNRPETGPGGRPAWSGDDRGTRLADVIIAWNVFEHFYPYFDVVKTDWSSVLPRTLDSAATDTDGAAFGDTLRRLVAELHDGHGGVQKTGFRAMLPLRWDWVEGKLVVTVTASALSGRVSPGDVVVKINGRAAAEALAAQEALVPGATPQWIRYRALQELAIGRPGVSVSLTIEPFSQPARTTELSLQYENDLPPEERRPGQIEEIDAGTYYVDVSRISDADFQAALPRLEQAHGIVFDFRGYPSKLGPQFLTHLSDRSLTSAQWHIPIVLWPDRRDIQFVRSGEWHLEPSKPLLTAKKAFITDGRAISYAESCMGIVEYYKLGSIVGGPTAGTNGNVNPFSLPGGYGITWTGMKVLKHDGSRHHGVGILPTIPVSRTRAGIAANRDELLESAVRAVR